MVYTRLSIGLHNQGAEGKDALPSRLRLFLRWRGNDILVAEGIILIFVVFLLVTVIAADGRWPAGRTGRSGWVLAERETGHG